MMLYSKSRWQTIGYKLKADAKITEWRETPDGDEYAVYDFDQVEPIKGGDAADRRTHHALEFNIQKMRTAAFQFWQQHQDASEDDVFEAAFRAGQESQHYDPFDNPITFDHEERQWLQERFEEAYKDFCFEASEDDMDMEVKSGSLGIPLCRRDAIPGEWCGFKTNSEWFKAGYTPNDKRKYSRAIYEYDGAVTPLFHIDECVELRGEEALARRRLFHRVVRNRLKHERTATTGQ